MAIICEICDSTNLLKQDGVFVCQDCGARYTAEEIKKMVSVAAPSPVPAPKEEVPDPLPKPSKDEEIAQLLEWAKHAYKEGNKGAGDTYLDKATRISRDRNVVEMCLEQGKPVDRSTLKEMIVQTPVEKRTAAYEFAYNAMEKQGTNLLCFPFTLSSHDRYKGRGTVEYLVGTIIPELRVEGFWDIDRMLQIHFKNAIRSMNEYQLPKPEIEEGLLANANWHLVTGIFITDKYLQDADEIVKSHCDKVELYKAFYKACDTILKGKFCAHPSSKSIHFDKITDSHYLYGDDRKRAKAVRAKYKKLIDQVEADTLVAIEVEKARQEKECRAAIEAANAAFWAKHPEEHSQLKSEKMLLEAKIQKLQRDHQADPQKKAMEQAKRDVNRYNYELQNCGIFQGKRKKELALLIGETQKKEQECRAAFEKNTVDYEEFLKNLQNQLTEINKKLNRE